MENRLICTFCEIQGMWIQDICVIYSELNSSLVFYVLSVKFIYLHIGELFMTAKISYYYVNLFFILNLDIFLTDSSLSYGTLHVLKHRAGIYRILQD